MCVWKWGILVLVTGFNESTGWLLENKHWEHLNHKRYFTFFYRGLLMILYQHRPFEDLDSCVLWIHTSHDQDLPDLIQTPFLYSLIRL